MYNIINFLKIYISSDKAVRYKQLQQQQQQNLDFTFLLTFC